MLINLSALGAGALVSALTNPATLPRASVELFAGGAPVVRVAPVAATVSGGTLRLTLPPVQSAYTADEVAVEYGTHSVRGYLSEGGLTFAVAGAAGFAPVLAFAVAIEIPPIVITPPSDPIIARIALVEAGLAGLASLTGDATETVKGVVRYATTAETIAGTSDRLALTPKGLKEAGYLTIADISRMPSPAQKRAMDDANGPGEGNPFATMLDIEYIQCAVIPGLSATYASFYGANSFYGPNYFVGGASFNGIYNCGGPTVVYDFRAAGVLDFWPAAAGMRPVVPIGSSADAIISALQTLGLVVEV